VWCLNVVTTIADSFFVFFSASDARICRPAALEDNARSVQCDSCTCPGQWHCPWASWGGAKKEIWARPVASRLFQSLLRVVLNLDKSCSATLAIGHTDQYELCNCN